MILKITNKTKTRIFSNFHIDKKTNCWVWGGYLSDGYGRFYWNKRRYKAHRFIYEMFVEEIPVGKQLDHLCRNRACVNPEHLEVVDNKTNVLRGIGITAINARKKLCIHGHILSPDNRGKRYCRTCNHNYMTTDRRRAYKRKYYRDHHGIISGKIGPSGLTNL